MAGAAPQGLPQAIAAGRREVEALATLLAEEREALRTRDGERLTAIAERKQAHFSVLDALDLPGRLPGAEGVESALAAEHGDRTAAEWRDLVSSLRAVRRENEVNGLTIQRTLSAVATEIALLHGHAGPGERTYAQNGRRSETGGVGSLLSRA